MMPVQIHKYHIWKDNRQVGLFILNKEEKSQGWSEQYLNLFDFGSSTWTLKFSQRNLLVDFPLTYWEE